MTASCVNHLVSQYTFDEGQNDGRVDNPATIQVVDSQKVHHSKAKVRVVHFDLQGVWL